MTLYDILLDLPHSNKEKEGSISGDLSLTRLIFIPTDNGQWYSQGFNFPYIFHIKLLFSKDHIDVI